MVTYILIPIKRTKSNSCVSMIKTE